MHNRTRTILAMVIITIVLTALGLALAGETDNTTASYGYPADTAVGELQKPAVSAEDVETTHTPEPETTVPETTVPETEAPVTTVPETTAPETMVPGAPAPTDFFPLLEEEVGRVFVATLSKQIAFDAVAGGKEARVLRLTAIAVKDGYATVQYGGRTFPVHCPEDVPQPMLLYFILR